MNSQEKFIYDQVMLGAKDADQRKAESHALQAVFDFGRNNYNPRKLKKKKCTPADLIEQRIFMAVNEK